MKKVYYLLFSALISHSVSAQIEGTWKLAPRAGSLAVGPSETDFSWWSNSEADLVTRACLFDDSLTFGAGGSLMHYMDGQTWLEAWQGVAAEQCGAPVSPHDGAGTYTYAFDAVANTLTINGLGGHIGLAKVINGSELTSPAGAPQSVTYNVSFSNNNNTMTALISIGAGFWRFTYDRTDAVEIPNPNVTFSVDMNQYTGTIANGVFVNGSFNGWCGECNPMTNVGNNIWEVTLPLAPGNIEYKFTVDGWTAFEEFATVLACIDPVADGFNNRFFSITEDVEIPTVCFNSCEACVTNSLENLDLNSKVTLTPNPANDKVTISSTENTTSIEIYNVAGTKILDLKNMNSTKNEINVSNFSAGIYYFNVKTNEGTSVQKLIIE